MRFAVLLVLLAGLLRISTLSATLSESHLPRLAAFSFPRSVRRRLKSSEFNDGSSAFACLTRMIFFILLRAKILNQAAPDRSAQAISPGLIVLPFRLNIPPDFFYNYKETPSGFSLCINNTFIFLPSQNHDYGVSTNV